MSTAIQMAMEEMFIALTLKMRLPGLFTIPAVRGGLRTKSYAAWKSVFEGALPVAYNGTFAFLTPDEDDAYFEDITGWANKLFQTAVGTYFDELDTDSWWDEIRELFYTIVEKYAAQHNEETKPRSLLYTDIPSVIDSSKYCPVCITEDCEQPLILGCGHSLCFECYATLTTRNEPICPLCKYPIDAKLVKRQK